MPPVKDILGPCGEPMGEALPDTTGALALLFHSLHSVSDIHVLDMKLATGHMQIGQR